MNSKHIKTPLSLLLCFVLFCTAFAGCSHFKDFNVFGKPTTTEAETSTTQTTTTETTTVTTTEDPDTTFAENETRKIYPGLVKDKSDAYSYLIAQYTTQYRASDTTRTANLAAAVDKIDNIVVPSGQVFSFNQTVGKRTVTAGYEEAKVIKDGEFVDGLGGGVCQVSSTIFEAVLRANVKIVTRTCHSLEISYVPLGGDATVQWNSCDFQFENTTGTDIRLNMHCNGGKLTCEVYAKEALDVGKVNINIYKDGDKYVLTRTVNGEENYRTVSKYAKPKPTTTKAP